MQYHVSDGVSRLMHNEWCQSKQLSHIIHSNSPVGCWQVVDAQTFEVMWLRSRVNITCRYWSAPSAVSVFGCTSLQMASTFYNKIQCSWNLMKNKLHSAQIVCKVIWVILLTNYDLPESISGCHGSLLRLVFSEVNEMLSRGYEKLLAALKLQ